ncbi:MAG: hypothetical protein HY770_02390, partial [Chitinivibrionia bacterium]|nr:hypothetical protein [Chitinivibrionia bacterium]
MARKFISIPFEAGLLGIALMAMLLMPAEADAGNLTFTVSLPRDLVIVKNHEGRTEVSVDQKSYFLILDENAPSLPVTILNVILPQGEAFDAVDFVMNGDAIIAENAQLELNPPSIAEDGIQGKGKALFAAAEAGSAFPKVPVTYLGTGSLHGFSIASFAVSPLRYENGSVRLSEEITLHVKTAAATAVRPASHMRFREGFQEDVRGILASLAANPEAADAYRFDQVTVPRNRGGFQPSSIPSLEGSPVDYLIITTNALSAEFQRLADWKTKQGVPAVVRTVEWIEQNSRHGVDLAETIRLFIRDAYEQWGIKWVLLGGDTDVIPTRLAYSRFYNNGTKVPTDLYFACLDGSWNDNHNSLWGEGFYYAEMDNPDLYAEVYAGRITASKASEVADVVDKVISYATPYDRDYLNKVLMLAEVLFPVDWEPGQSISSNGADYSEYIYTSTMEGKPLDVTRSYETWEIYPGSVPETRQATIDSMNAGVGVINHIGHGFRFNLSVGDASFLSTDADALTNTDRYFLLYMLNCTAAAFDYYCLGEHFLKNPSGGGVSIIGASRSAYPSASSYYMNEFFDLLYNHDVVHVGETFARSRLPRTPSAEAGDNIDEWTHFIYVILSDPELAIWTGPVDTLSVSHVAGVGLGQNTIQVTVTAGGSPVDSAYVCLYKGTDDYVYGSTDALGVATFDFICEKPGAVSVVVTGRNHARHQSSITVNPSSDPYINYAYLSVDDDQLNGTFGNSNGSIDAGETAEFMLSL